MSFPGFLITGARRFRIMNVAAVDPSGLWGAGFEVSYVDAAGAAHRGAVGELWDVPFERVSQARPIVPIICSTGGADAATQYDRRPRSCRGADQSPADGR